MATITTIVNVVVAGAAYIGAVAVLVASGAVIVAVAVAADHVPACVSGVVVIVGVVAVIVA